MNINFFNHFRNGDVHVSRSYILDIMSKMPKNHYSYIQNPDHTLEYILRDIKQIKHSFNIIGLDKNSSINKIENEIFINTWYGQSNFKYFKESISTNKADDCSFYILYDIFQDIYRFLEIEIYPFEYYFPRILFENLDRKKINDFFSEQKFDKYVLICDNPVQSGQSFNFDFKPIVNQLSSKYDNIAFITTSNNIIARNNLFSTNDIIGLKFDLNEISYLSTKCDIIVGRGSGPYTFSLTKENLMNESKKFVAFTNTKIVALGLNDGDYKCKLNWSSDYGQENILNNIKEFI